MATLAERKALTAIKRGFSPANEALIIRLLAIWLPATISSIGGIRASALRSTFGMANGKPATPFIAKLMRAIPPGEKAATLTNVGRVAISLILGSSGVGGNIIGGIRLILLIVLLTESAKFAEKGSNPATFSFSIRLAITYSCIIAEMSIFNDAAKLGVT